jgi:hypothetical protein
MYITDFILRYSVRLVKNIFITLVKYILLTCYVNIIYVLFLKIEFRRFQFNADIAQKFI